VYHGTHKVAQHVVDAPKERDGIVRTKESGVRKHWKTLAIAAVVAVLGLSVVAAAYGATKGSGSTKRTRTLAGACAQLFKNPQAVQDMQALRAEHQKEMQQWWATYGNGPTGADAQAALKELRAEHWNDMKALFDKYGVKLPANARPGNAGYGMMGGGAGCGGAGCGAGGAGCGGFGQSGTTGTGYGMMGGGMMGGTTY
jgi:hypothetical protein